MPITRTHVVAKSVGRALLLVLLPLLIFVLSVRIGTWSARGLWRLVHEEEMLEADWVLVCLSLAKEASLVSYFERHSSDLGTFKVEKKALGRWWLSRNANSLAAGDAEKACKELGWIECDSNTLDEAASILWGK